MKIFQLSLHPPFDPARVATGSQVREAGLAAALTAAGHQITFCAPLPAGERAGSELYYSSPQQLAARIAACRPDAILVAYWTLLAALPAVQVPVILDCIAPRLLEAMYQTPGTLQHESRQLLALLARADHFLVGNQRQGDLLLTLLLLAGIDCRERVPVSLVPIATDGTPLPYTPPQDSIQVVSAGVDWPWRQSAAYVAVIEDWCRTHPQFALRTISGAYPGADTQATGLLGYRDMQQALRASQLGLELGARNTEREFSQSFRLAEYLQCGLPVLVNPWLPLADTIRAWDAGWLVATPEELRAVLQQIASDPALLARKAAGARRLAQEQLNYRQVCAPLLAYLAAPWQPRKEAVVFAAAPLAPVPAPPRGWRWQAALVQLYQLVFCRKRPRDCADILMVTRSDLFPPDHGAAVKIVRTAESLSRLGRKVYLCTDKRREYYCFTDGVMRVQPYPRWLPLLALPRRLALLRLLLAGYPWSNAFLYFPLKDFSYIVRALYLATRFPVGAGIAEFPAYVRPLRFVRKLLGGRIVLVEHNVEYERLREQIRDLSPHAYQQLKRTELDLCAAADAVITVSDNDRLQLLRDGVDPRKLQTIPHGVDLAAFRTTPVAAVRARYGIPAAALLLVYHGPYSYAPNLQAMTVMARELLPLLARRGLQVKVLAIGSKPPQASLHPDIIFTGAVDSLAAVLPAADLAVVPLREGGGTRMKILDYFAAGVPVISTTKGIEGIPVQHGEHALIVDEMAVMADAIVALAGDRARARQLAEHARDFVEGLGWDAIAARYLPLLQGPAER